MAKVEVYNLKREPIGEIELADTVFAVDVNQDVIYEVLKAQLASRRVGSAKTKTRSEVSGSSKKMYRQKGTGRARHGTLRAPTMVGGGVAHGPRPRSYQYRPPRKMRIGAMCSALSLKLKDNALMVVEGFDLEEIKTKALARVLDTLKVGDGSLIVDANGNQKLRLSARNLALHQVLSPEGVNLYDLLRHKHLVLTKEAVAALEARFYRV
ncbi:MAG: 50S ribosomal protein L4 [Deltaproteobacteria bacterium]|nr:50S ribosomal protein L4 [Deltaproteobacteria bacterium]